MDDIARHAQRTFAFGPFVLMPERQLLMRNGKAVRIGGRALDLLAALVERPGELVSKSELVARAWPNTNVDESNLKVNMASVRRALGDGASSARFVSTVNGMGYRFIAKVQLSESLTPALQALPTTIEPHNLPTATTRVIGRADVIDSVSLALEGGRLVSLVGAGGIGKTTVALAIAENSIGLFRDGVWFVDFASLSDPSLVPNVIATAIGLGVHSADALTCLCRSLAEREMLLLLDNCEHLIEAIARCVDEILASAKSVKIMTTGREALGLRAEVLHRIPGLAIPPVSTQLKADEALTFPAIQLFVDRAADRQESFTVTDADAPLMAEICQKLDGLPLAIELAAMRVDAFGIGGLLKQIDDRFRLLSGRRAGLERHRTLAATLDWSFGLLPPDEATLLCAVAVFAGVFDLDAASAIFDDTPAAVGQGLSHLAAKSLLTVQLNGDRVSYRLLETTREYCLERLRTKGDEPVTRHSHAEYVCTLLEKAGKEWTVIPSPDWGSRYAGAIDDLRAALAWTARDESNQPFRIRLTVAGLMLWSHLSLTEECRAHVARAVTDLETSGLTGSALEMQLQVWLGSTTMFTRGLKHQAMEAMRRALNIAVEIGDDDHRLRCLRMIGIFEMFNGKHEAGLRTLESFGSIAAARDPSLIPEGESHIAIAELFLGRLRSARVRLEGLHRRNQHHKDDLNRVRYMSNRTVDVECVLSQVRWLTGSPENGAQIAAAAVERARSAGHHLSLNSALSYACPVIYWNGDFEMCDRYVAMLEDQANRHGFDVRRPVAMFYRAVLLCEDENCLAMGLDQLEHAIAEFHALGHLARMPFYMAGRAGALARYGSLGLADSLIREALDLARAQQEKWCEPELLRIHASILTAAGRADEAEARLGQSMELSRETGALSWRLRAANDLVRLSPTAEKARHARDILASVVGEYTEGYQTRDMMTAATLLGWDLSRSARMQQSSLQ